MKYKYRIIQVMPTLAFGDGVGNDALAMDAILKKQGIQTAIYAEDIDERIPEGIAQHVSDMPKLRKKDIVIYHLSIGGELNERLREWKVRKIVIYHNVTPDKFFAGYNEFTRTYCLEGRKSVARLKDTPDYCLADSGYNKQELIDLGYQCKIDVLPIIIPFQDYQKKPSERVLQQYAGDGYTNILFTGRISPNKKQEDIIQAFTYYQKYYNPKSRLFLVGSYKGIEVYQERLKKYVSRLGVQNVIFTGHIPFDEILAYYALADVFLCLSEHEGFCIPLVEAMIFKIPIIAYQDTGVTGTMGTGGFPLTEKNPMEIAGVIDYVQTHPEVREELIRRGQEQLQIFDTQRVEKQFLQYLEDFISGR